MIDRSVLAAWAAGALDPVRTAEVDEALARDEGLRTQAAALRAEMAAPWPPDDGWRLPLPRAGARLAVMGRAGVGDPVALPVPAGEGEVVVLHRAEQAWEQVLPGPDGAPVAASSLHPREVLVVPTSPGTHDWAVIVAPAGAADLQGAVARGAVPVARVRVEVG